MLNQLIRLALRRDDRRAIDMLAHPGLLDWSSVRTMSRFVGHEDFAQEEWRPHIPDFACEPDGVARDFLRSQGLDIEDLDQEDMLWEHANEEWQQNEPEVMLNHIWPLPHVKDPNFSAIMMRNHTNCALIETDNAYAIGVTGAGMDFSQDIALAFIIAGHYPPATLYLPRLAGRDLKHGPTVLATLCLAQAQQQLSENLQRDALRHRDMLREPANG